MLVLKETCRQWHSKTILGVRLGILLFFGLPNLISIGLAFQMSLI